MDKSLTEIKKKPESNFLNANLRYEWSIELFDALAFMHSKDVAKIIDNSFIIFIFDQLKLNKLSNQFALCYKNCNQVIKMSILL